MPDKSINIDVRIAWPAGILAGTLIFIPTPPMPPGPVASISFVLDPPGPRHPPGPVVSTSIVLDPPGPRSF